MQPLATAFRLASRLRGARAFHPRGHLFHATWRPASTDAVLAGSPLTDGAADALIRVSHAVGLPPRLPDILGLAVKVLDVHGPGRDQDLLLASSGSGPVGRHVLLPTRTLTGTVLSTLLPYDIDGGGRAAIVAQAVDRTTEVTYAGVASGAQEPPTFEVRIGAPDGPLLATVVPGARGTDVGAEAIRFDPWHTGPGLRPVGWPNRVRRPTYEASQAGRDAPPDGWRATRD